MIKNYLSQKYDKKNELQKKIELFYHALHKLC